MTSPDLKKLITGFLILSAIVSSSALIAANFASQRALTPPKAALKSNDQQEKLVPGIGDNAFIETPTAPLAVVNDGGENSAGDLPPPPPIDPSNLTESLTGRVIHELITSNPDGPTLIDNKPVLRLQDFENLDKRISEDAVNLNIDELIKTEVPENEIKILSEYGAKDITNYAESVNQILQETVNSEKSRELAKKEVTPESLIAVQLIYSQAARGIKSLAVPQPFAKAHQKLVVMIGNQQKIFDVSGDYQRDPLKSLIVINKAREIINRDLKNLQEENSKVDVSKTISRNGARRWLSFFASPFSVRKAEAVIGVPVMDFITESQTTAEHLLSWKDYLEKIATQILKNTLINQLGQQVISWINGGGKPKFITNWKGFLAGAAKDAAGFAIQDATNGTCQIFTRPLRLQLQSAFLTPAPRPICTLEQVVQSVENFYKNFSTGGWLAYSQIVLPSGNYYGSLFEASQRVGLAANQAAAAAKAQGQSDQSLLPTQVCVNYENIPVLELVNGVPTPTTKRQCSQNESTTPGRAVAGQLDRALGGAFDNISGANDYIGLIAAVIDSAISRLIASGAGGLANVSAGGQQGGDLSRFCAGITDPQELAACQQQVQNFQNEQQGQGSSRLSITTASPLRNAILGQPYIQTLAVSGGTPPFVWSLEAGNLDDFGLGFGNAVISGTPNATGTVSLLIKVEDSATPSAEAAKSFTITVLETTP